MRVRHLLPALLLCVGMTATAQTPDMGHRLSARTSALLSRQQAEAAADSMVAAYISYSPERVDREALERLGVKTGLELDGVATARIPLKALAAVSGIQGVEYVQAATGAQPMLDVARTETGIATVNAGTGLPQAFTGQGVVVGVVDLGFDYTHAAFRDKDGKLRIKRVWEQDVKPADGQASPEQFGYGLEMTTPEEITAAGGDIRGNSHGTHVACIAAGSSMHDGGALRGMAPDADIVLVSMADAGSSNVNITNAIAYIFAYADAVGKPCVINLSLGSNIGPHDGTSTFDTMADLMQGAGRLIVGATGNHNAGIYHHIYRHFGEADKGKPLSSFIDYQSSPSPQNTGDNLELWLPAEAQLKVALVVYKLSTGAEVARAEADLSASDPATLSLGRNVSGHFLSTAERSPLNGKTHLLLQSQVSAIRTDHAIAIEVTPLSAFQLDIWSDTGIAFSSRGMSGFTTPSATDPSVCEIGGTSRRILAVGAYTTRSEYTVYGSETPQSLAETTGDLCSFSNCGPTADGRTKPDVTAPGAYISAAVSQYDNSGSLVLSRFFSDDGVSASYGYMQGTSMSSPMVAGIVAAWLQAYPQLTPEELKEVVHATARTDTFTGNIPSEGSNQWGWGKIDAVAGLQACMRLAADGIAATPSFPIGGEAIYTISGQRVRRADKPGVYVVNGRKMLVKGY